MRGSEGRELIISSAHEYKTVSLPIVKWCAFRHRSGRLGFLVGVLLASTKGLVTCREGEEVRVTASLL